jgi:hypothetical protein
MHSSRFFRMMMALKLLYQVVNMFLLASPRTVVLLSIMIKQKTAPKS